MSQETTVAEHEQIFFFFKSSYLKERLQRKEARTWEKAWLCQGNQDSQSLSLPLHFIYRSGSSCGLLTQSRWTPATAWCAALCCQLIGQTTHWLQTPHCCTVSYYAALKGKKERCYRCSTLQFYQYLCCKEWHLQLFHNYLAGFPAIHLPNCCYDRWHTSSTITRVTVRHIYFTTQHLPSVFPESLNGPLIFFSFLQLLSHSEKQFFFLFIENMSHKPTSWNNAT